jgi:Asp-tRNA(Asn)/Glu-tRNA(Gln) amidotransferase A subunit family amidase
MTHQTRPTSARRTSQQIANDPLQVTALLDQCRNAVDARDAEIKAFQFVDWTLVEEQAAHLQTVPVDKRGPLFGLPVAVKDIFDTADMPTTYGSTIYAGHRPSVDAACVARLRAAGAIIIGKTVTTEFAYWHAGPTRNPHDTSRTPGGSSSGSCAGLAAGMFALALGSQTAASTIRPAAYCGIVGFKPSRQWISRAGVKALAGNSLDAVGLFGRSVDDVSLLAGVMAGVELAPETETSPTHVRVSSWRGQEWHGAESYAVAAVEAALEKLATAGAGVGRVTPSSDFDGLIDLQKLIMAREAAGDLAHEHLNHRDQLSDTLAGFLDEGANISADSYCSAIAHANDCRARIGELFGDADILVAPAAPGEAPAFEEGTGSPDMSRAWTLLDLPSLTIPCGTGPSGLPLGIQLAARPGHDRVLLGAAVWIEQQLQSAAA